MLTTGAGGLPAKHLLEMALRQPVLALKEKGTGELQAHPHELRPRDQHRAEGGNGLVQQGFPGFPGEARLLGSLGCRKPKGEKDVGMHGPAARERSE